jgi:hypothetical protein
MIGDTVERSSEAGSGRGRFWVAAASSLSSAGLVVVASAYALARLEMSGATVLYWIGLAAIVVPVVVAATSDVTSRTQRLGLVLLLTLMLYFVQALYRPLEFAFHDELQHLRTLLDIMVRGELFTPNALLPISPFYPGIEIVTHALASTIGASPEVAGTIVGGAAKLVLSLATFTLFERVTGSSRLATVAVLVYATNPHFIFFNSMFAYVTLALPLMMLALVWLHGWSGRAGTPRARADRVATLLVLAALVVTHHVTALVALAVLAGWTLVATLWRRDRPYRLAVTQATLFLLAAIVGWNLLPGVDTLGYLAVALSGAIAGLTGATAGTAPPSPPLDRPPWEWLASAATVGYVALAVPLGVWAWWRRALLDPAAVVLIALAGLFYLGIAARFLPGGAELAGRSWAYAYFGVALSIAALLTLRFSSSRWVRLRPIVVVLSLSLLFVGGVTLGYPAHWGRLPGPYLVSAFERSVEEQGIAAATWAADALGSRRRVATDLTNGTLMGSYGDQDPVRGVYPVFFSPTVDEGERRRLVDYGVEFVLVDLRLCSGLPQVGFYVVSSEPGAYRYETPLPCDRLEKFDHDPGFARRYDGGSIRIYEVVFGDGAVVPQAAQHD